MLDFFPRKQEIKIEKMPSLIYAHYAQQGQWTEFKVERDNQYAKILDTFRQCMKEILHEFQYNTLDCARAMEAVTQSVASPEIRKIFNEKDLTEYREICIIVKDNIAFLDGKFRKIMPMIQEKEIILDKDFNRQIKVEFVQARFFLQMSYQEVIEKKMEDYYLYQSDKEVQETSLILYQNKVIQSCSVLNYFVTPSYVLNMTYRWYLTVQAERVFFPSIGDAFYKICSYLTGPELRTLSIVCKEWKPARKIESDSYIGPLVYDIFFLWAFNEKIDELEYISYKTNDLHVQYMMQLEMETEMAQYKVCRRYARFTSFDTHYDITTKDNSLSCLFHGNILCDKCDIDLNHMGVVGTYEVSKYGVYSECAEIMDLLDRMLFLLAERRVGMEQIFSDRIIDVHPVIIMYGMYNFIRKNFRDVAMSDITELIFNKYRLDFFYYMQMEQDRYRKYRITPRFRWYLLIKNPIMVMRPPAKIWKFNLYNGESRHCQDRVVRYSYINQRAEFFEDKCEKERQERRFKSVSHRLPNGGGVIFTMDEMTEPEKAYEDQKLLNLQKEDPSNWYRYHLDMRKFK